MSKFEIRSPLMIAAALALTPTLAFAEGDPSQHGGTTTTTTTTKSSPSDSSATSASNPSPASPQAPASIDMNRPGMAPPSEPSIDPSQVQKVFGMDVALIDLKSLNSDQIKQLQQRLTERGFYRGKADGVIGPQTKNALSGLMAQQFALNQRLVSQGQITEQFASSLGVDTAGRAPVNGVDDPSSINNGGLPQGNQGSTLQRDRGSSSQGSSTPSNQGSSSSQGSSSRSSSGQAPSNPPPSTPPNQ